MVTAAQQAVILSPSQLTVVAATRRSGKTYTVRALLSRRAAEVWTLNRFMMKSLYGDVQHSYFYHLWEEVEYTHRFSANVVLDECDNREIWLDVATRALHQGSKVWIFLTPHLTVGRGYYPKTDDVFEKAVSLVYQTNRSSELHLWTENTVNEVVYYVPFIAG